MEIEVEVSNYSYREELQGTELYTLIFRHEPCKSELISPSPLYQVVSNHLQIKSLHTTAKDQANFTASEHDQMFDTEAINDPRESPPHF